MDSQKQREEVLNNGICDMKLDPDDEDSNNKTQSNIHKRNDYIEWPDYFMAIAFLSAQRSKDPSTQVGACIVNEDKKIVGIGYNGMPLGCDDDVMPWNRDGASMLDTKHAYGKLPTLGSTTYLHALTRNTVTLQNYRLGSLTLCGWLFPLQRKALGYQNS